MKEKLFSVLPMSQRYSLEAGGTYSGSIIVANPYDATEDFSFVVSVEPLSTFNDAESFSESGAYSDIVDWITIENPTGTIKPNEYRTVNYTINVPEGVPAGGQYATLVVAEDPDTATMQDLNVSNILVLASVIYADVTGITVRDGSILDNYVPGFALSPDITLSTTIENRGNTHSDAIIFIDIRNAFTNEAIFSTDDQSDKGQSDKFKEIVLPETIRYISHRIDNLPPLGIFKITQTVYFNDTVSTTEQNVIICPLWFIFSIVFTIVLIITVIFARIRYRKRRKLQYS